MSSWGFRQTGMFSYLCRCLQHSGVNWTGNDCKSRRSFSEAGMRNLTRRRVLDFQDGKTDRNLSSFIKSFHSACNSAVTASVRRRDNGARSFGGIHLRLQQSRLGEVQDVLRRQSHRYPSRTISSASRGQTRGREGMAGSFLRHPDRFGQVESALHAFGASRSGDPDAR
jgi:hypothetical protein